MGRTLTTQEFIEKAKKVHGDRYDYSKVKYKGATEKVCIICKEHGEFWQKPNNHISQKQGCPKCAGNIKNTTEDFIKKAKEIHCDKYDYSKVNYINNSIKVCIICPEHGEFWQTPNDHLDKHGCPECKKISIHNCRKSNFHILKQKISSNIIILSEDYYNNKNKIKCKCKTCSHEWEVRPDLLIRGSDCPICNSSKGEKRILKYLNEKHITFKTQYEITIDKRINSTGIAKIDFYLPDYNLFIEYNGIQHYIPIEYFGGKVRLQIQQRRDEYVRNYCKENMINLIEIKYDENIENKLNQFMSNYKFK